MIQKQKDSGLIVFSGQPGQQESVGGRGLRAVFP